MSSPHADRSHSLLILRESLLECLRLADGLMLDMITPHIDLALARLEEAAASEASTFSEGKSDPTSAD